MNTNARFLLLLLVVLAFGLAGARADVLSVTLNSPANDTSTTEPTPDFNFTAVGDSSDPKDCELFIDGVGNGTVVAADSTPAVITANTSLSFGTHSWEITCDDGAAPLTSETRLIHENSLTDCDTISMPGDYVLRNDLAAGASCIDITSNNVTLDCAGFNMTASSCCDSGIYLGGVNNVTVFNCDIIDFYRGIYLDGASSNIIDDNAINGSTYAMYLSSGSDFNQIIDNTLDETTYGFYVDSADSNVIDGNTILQTSTANFGSCPLLYSWNGTDYDFVTDISGSGLMGLQRDDGSYRKPRPMDYAKIEGSMLQDDAGFYKLQIAQEYDEISYLDELALITVDHAPDVDVFSTLVRASLGTFYTVGTSPAAPVSCADSEGNDCLSLVTNKDEVYYVGSDVETNVIELDLGDLSSATSIKLILSGFTGWEQSGVPKPFNQKFIQVKDPSGSWANAYSGNELGTPAGMPRTYVIDLTGKFLTNDYRVRISYDATVNFDYIAVDTTDQQAITVTQYSPVSADLHFRGYSTNVGDFPPLPDYGDVNDAPSNSFSLPSGNFTKFGDVLPLVTATDDKFVIMRHGDEVSVEFPYVGAGAGLERDFMLYSWDFYKPSYLIYGDSVSPLPFKDMSNYPYAESEQYPTDAEHQQYLEEWNTRYEPGGPVAGIALPFSFNNTVSNNFIEGDSFSIGLLLQFEDSTNIINNTITGASIGLELDDSVGTLVQGNNISFNVNDGIALYSSSDNTFVDNVVIGNGGYAFASYSDSNNNTGIDFELGTIVSFLGNDFTLNESAAPASGTTGDVGIEIHVNSTDNTGGDNQAVGVSDGDSNNNDVTSVLDSGDFSDAFSYTFDDTGDVSSSNIGVDITPLTSPTFVSLADDQVSGTIELPFLVHAYGKENRFIKISSNGFVYLSENPPVSSSDGCCGGEDLEFQDLTEGDDLLVAGLWTDLDPSDGIGTVSYGTEGAAPNRIFIVYFNDVSHCCEAEGGNTFQIKFFENGSNAASPPDGLLDIGHFADVQATDGDSWVRLNISYDDSDVATFGVDESTLFMARYSDGWETDTSAFASSSGVNTTGNYVFANITDFGSIFGPLGAGARPVVSDVEVTSSSGTDTTDEDLSVSYSVTDVDDDAVRNITDWRLDGESIALINMPFEAHELSAVVANDYSSHDNDGSVLFDAVWTDAGYIGGAYTFDGSDSVVSVSNSSGGDFTFTDFTYSVWINVDSLSGSWQTVIDLDTDLQLLAINPSDKYAIYGRCGSDPFGGFADAEEGVWHHVAWVVSGTDYFVYVDGVLVGSETGACTESETGTTINIGAGYTGSTDEVFGGTIDEVLIFDRALSAAQIALLAVNDSDTIDADETELGDGWSACVTGNDEFGDGDTECSDELTIIEPAAPSRGGLGGGAPPAAGTTVTVPIEAIEAGSQQELSVGDTVTFTLNGETHSGKIISLGTDYVVIEFSSTPFRVTIKTGETKLVDLDFDGIFDLSVFLEKIVSGKAFLTYKSIRPQAEAVPPAVEGPTGEIVGPPAEAPAPVPGPAADNTLMIIVAALIVIAIVIGAWWYKKQQEEV